MKGFSGFPQKGRLTKIPGLFFSALLPQIDSLAEMKVTLYCFWRLQQKEGQVTYVWEDELAGDQIFMAGLAGREEQRRQALQEGLERAVARGTLLQVEVSRRDGQTGRMYFVNTERGRAAVKGIEAGKWSPDAEPDTLLDLSVERPNIFTLYEQNIGPLTPLIADRLQDFEATYPSDWIEEAIRIAVARNKRNLSYMDAILKRWQTEGRQDNRDHTSDGQRFISGKYRDEIEY
ncbi:MAG: DnaD domain protein [Anaerolineae bacterium]|nr:DnaD domain protein [Anaerolineae bacterium]